jgi:hypothetical protein
MARASADEKFLNTGDVEETKESAQHKEILAAMQERVKEQQKDKRARMEARVKDAQAALRKSSK